MPKTIVTIGGNIGCGKSTLLRECVISIPRAKSSVVFPEPIEKWGSWLDMFYSNPTKYGFQLQMKILVDFLYFDASHDDTIVITERSPLDSLHVFCKLMVDSKTITHMEYNLFKEYMDTISWQPNVYIYLKTTPEACFQRMKDRSRECETGVDFSYIKNLHMAYEKFIETIKEQPTIEVYEIDATQDKESVNQQTRVILEKYDFFSQ